MVRVVDAAAMMPLLEQLDDDESLEGWLGDELLVHVAAAVTEGGLQLDDPSLPEQAAARAREALTEYGIEVQRIDRVEVAGDE
jgi:hypothetical protein